LKILITGGAGFVGHNLALYLHNRGYTVIAFDSMERAVSRAYRKLYDSGVTVVHGDVRDEVALSAVVKSVDLVIHGAAYVRSDESFNKPREYIDNNVGGTAVVAKSCLEYNKPLVYISSAAVYGNPLKLPINEDHPTNPVSIYGLTKLMGEHVVKLYGNFGLKYVIVRPFNIYGSGQSEEYAGVITRFISRACRGEPLIIYGDGLQTRDFIHIYDFSRLVELIIERGPYGEVFNAGSGRPMRIIDLAELIRALTRKPVEIVHAPPRIGDIRDSWADISKAKKLLGFQPTVNIERGLADLIDELCVEKRSPPAKTSA